MNTTLNLIIGRFEVYGAEDFGTFQLVLECQYTVNPPILGQMLSINASRND